MPCKVPTNVKERNNIQKTETISILPWGKRVTNFNNHNAIHRAVPGSSGSAKIKKNSSSSNQFGTFYRWVFIFCSLEFVLYKRGECFNI